MTRALAVGAFRVALFLFGLATAPVAFAAAPAAEPVCRAVTHEGAGYVVCTVDLRRQELRLFWRAPDGQPYANLARLAEDHPGQLLAAMNAGMYDQDLAPLGLYVEAGRQLRPANVAGGEGNFHLKPNGVFFVARGEAGILETAEYLRRKPRADLATQSGPLLVIEGAIHPKISEDGPSRKMRNGVGVRDPGTVVFAISDEPVSFGAFARLFRDALGCRNALFLDGSISSLYAPELGRRDIALKPLGPLIGVLARTGAAVPAAAK